MTNVVYMNLQQDRSEVFFMHKLHFDNLHFKVHPIVAWGRGRSTGTSDKAIGEMQIVEIVWVS